jgi:23S rRNA pseudouridine1911/1915/1917 synthase
VTADRPAQPGRHTFAVGEGETTRLDLLVARRLDLSRTQAATLIATGQVRVGGRRERAAYHPRSGEEIVVEIPPSPDRPMLGEPIPVDVVFEDEALVVVNKPAGMVVHPAPGNWSGTLVNALIGRGAELSAGGEAGRPGIVHRLDKDTSGLLLVAKTDRAHRLLAAAIAARRVARRYAVLCWGHVATDDLSVEKPIGRDPRDRKRMAIVHSGRAARTDFRRLARFDAVDLLRAHLHTGRTHQIRVHLASLGHPVVGDDTYGGGGGRRLVGLAPRRHFLHAAWLVFRHPMTGREIDLRAPLPGDLRASLDAVAATSAPNADIDPLEHFGFYTVDQ